VLQIIKMIFFLRLTRLILVDATSVIEDLKDKMHFDRVDVEINVAKVSVVGAGMLGNPGIAAGMFGALG
jgi:aspartate kinase